MRILDRIDDLQLDLAQRVSDAMDRTFGIDHWRMAKSLLVVGAGLILIELALLFTMPASNVAGRLMVLLVSAAWFWSYDSLSKRLARQRASRDAGSALRVSERRSRQQDLMICILVIAFNGPDWHVSSTILTAAIACFHLHYHFKAAETPPPEASNRLAWQA